MTVCTNYILWPNVRVVHIFDELSTFSHAIIMRNLLLGGGDCFWEAKPICYKLVAQTNFRKFVLEKMFVRISYLLNQLFLCQKNNRKEAVRASHHLRSPNCFSGKYFHTKYFLTAHYFGYYSLFLFCFLFSLSHEHEDLKQDHLCKLRGNELSWDKENRKQKRNSE